MADKELVMKLEEDISWLEQGCTTEKEICEHIKQAIKTIIQHKETETSWHTGTPTEEGLYILHCTNGIDDYHFNQLKNGNWRFHWLGKLIAWQKFEPYKEKEE